ncbi:MAG: hypothetical protein VCC00_10155 [Deltaproteobacteria bacterium]
MPEPVSWKERMRFFVFDWLLMPLVRPHLERIDGNVSKLDTVVGEVSRRLSDAGALRGEEMSGLRQEVREGRAESLGFADEVGSSLTQLRVGMEARLDVLEGIARQMDEQQFGGLRGEIRETQHGLTQVREGVEARFAKLEEATRGLDEARSALQTLMEQALAAAIRPRDERLGELNRELERLGERIARLGEVVTTTSAQLSEADTTLAEKLLELGRGTPSH